MTHFYLLSSLFCFSTGLLQIFTSSTWTLWDSQMLDALACTGIALLPGSQCLPPFIIICIFIALPKVFRSWAATISIPFSKCSLILQLCLLCTFRHYSFSPGSEPCKLRQSPSTHTQNSWKPELLDFNIRGMQGIGAITHRLPSSLCPFLHSKEDKCCDLLFWHSFEEDCVSKCSKEALENPL